MKKTLLLAVVILYTISTYSQNIFYSFNTITLLDPLTSESYGSVQNDVEIEFIQSNKTIVIKNYFTHSEMSLVYYDTSFNKEVKLFFCYDDDGNNVKVFVGNVNIVLNTKAVPYSTVFSNE